MSPQQVSNIGDVIAKFVLPFFLGFISIVGGCTVSELQSIRQELGNLKVKVAELGTEMKMFRGE